MLARRHATENPETGSTAALDAIITQTMGAGDNPFTGSIAN